MTVINRPRPLRSIAGVWGSLHGIASGVIVSLVTAGMLSQEQGSLYDNALSAGDVAVSAIVGLIAAIAPIVASLVTVVNGEKHVTPISDPRVVTNNADGEPILVPLEAKMVVPRAHPAHAAEPPTPYIPDR